ncbi:MAG TPA: hypothetical protein VNK26_08900 [Pyrinomonadaceae bacterium]|nr:hypothetical protein [Pyrinomonadaceae bacterium]
MKHFLYLVLFAVTIGAVFCALSEGSSREKITHGLKAFLQFLIISMVLAWVFYFIPW